jgi:hypothetical protein
MRMAEMGDYTCLFMMWINNSGGGGTHGSRRSRARGPERVSRASLVNDCAPRRGERMIGMMEPFTGRG